MSFNAQVEKKTDIVITGRSYSSEKDKINNTFVECEVRVITGIKVEQV
jgi:hypothetical protein